MLYAILAYHVEAEVMSWTKQQDEKYGLGLLKTLSDWAKLRDFPAKMIHWSTDQVQLAYAEACVFMQGSPAPAMDPPQAANGAANGRDDAPNLGSREPAQKEDQAKATTPGAPTRKDRERSQPRAARTH